MLLIQWIKRTFVLKTVLYSTETYIYASIIK